MKAFKPNGVHKAVGQHEWTETPSQKLARLTGAATLAVTSCCICCCVCSAIPDLGSM